MMNRLSAILTLAVLAFCFTSNAFAGNPTYAITNDDNPTGNTGTVFVRSPRGQLTILKTLQTGGTGFGGGYFGAPRIVIGNNGDCIFLADSGSGDIASFRQATGFSKVGNYSGGSLQGNYAGIGLAASQDGKFLYAAYSASSNIQAWGIGAGSEACQLTPIGQPVGDIDETGPLAVSNDGKVLIVLEPDDQVVLAFKSANGVLTPLGSPIELENEPQCSKGCTPGGLDITNVSAGKALVVLGNASESAYFITLTLDESEGLTFVGNTEITNIGRLANAESPVFSREARMGTGNLYFAMAGSDCGIVILSINSGIINPVATGSYDATLKNGDATYCSNVAIADSAGNGGEGEGIWQNDIAGEGANAMWFYSVQGNAITPYAHLINPNGNSTFVLSIASPGGNPN